jgi:hypothetical protein
MMSFLAYLASSRRLTKVVGFGLLNLIINCKHKTGTATFNVPIPIDVIQVKRLPIISFDFISTPPSDTNHGRLITARRDAMNLSSTWNWQLGCSFPSARSKPAYPLAATGRKRMGGPHD